MASEREALDTRALREALCVLADRHSVGLVVGDRDGAIVFATGRAQRLLGPGASMMPAEIQRFVDDVARDSKNDGVTRMSLAGSHHPVKVRATRLPGTPRHLLVALEEEGPRASLAKRLVETYRLSTRSVQLVQLASRGLTNREIGERLRLAEATVKSYMHALFRELGVRNRAELVVLAERLARDDVDE